MASRLKSTSKDGQSLKSRANESKGKRKSELGKLAKVDSANYKAAPAMVKKKIREDYSRGKSKKSHEKNKGRYI